MVKSILIFIFSIGILFAQSQQHIRQSGNYYFGSGISFDMREARDRALEELTEQIAVRVAKSFERKIQESGSQLDEDVKSILRTHSAATLQNVKTIKEPQADGRIRVFCYLAKTEVEKIFTARKKLIADMTRRAQQSESGGNIASALKLYYFSLLLVNSLPAENVLYQGENFTTAIPRHINSILGCIQFEPAGDVKISAKEREITLRITCKNKPVATLDFTFWDGSNQVAVQARDGLATFQLFGASTSFDELKLNVKYAYYEARTEYNVIADLWAVVDKPVFNSAQVLRLKDQPAKKHRENSATAAVKNWQLSLDYAEDVPVVEKITAAAVEFLNLIADGKTAPIRQRYAGDAFLRDKVSNYVRYNNPRPLSHKISARINKTKTGYELRKIRMLHAYPSINKQATEFLVLDFDGQGKLVDLNASITENLYQTFVKQSAFGNDWDRRQQIIKFVEKYRTAYLTRDIKTVDLMFAEDALILVGRKIERRKLPDSMDKYYHQFGNEPDYRYLRLTKEKYIERQRAVFAAQKDIFLDFSSFDIVQKNNAKHVYGVEMRQSYAATGYADEGYLFLLVDFSERDPLIYVRAWQPNEWSDSSLVRTANFMIYK